MTGSIKRFRVPKRTRIILWVEFGRGKPETKIKRVHGNGLGSKQDV